MKPNDELIRQADAADAVVRRVTVDALEKTAALLQMIADGTAKPTAAGVAARDLVRLLEILSEADALGRALREPTVPPSRRVH